MNLNDRTRLSVLEAAVARLIQGHAQRQVGGGTPGGGGGGVTDHGALTGLSDDDHPQYVTVDEALAVKALL